MASSSPTITTLSADIVTPASSTAPRCPMFLASGDIIWRWFYYNQYILFFKLQQPASSVIALLKSSLALALVEFFPWAGRMVEQDDGRLALDCNDAGVGFIESSIDLPFSSVEADGFQHQPFFKLLAPHGDVHQWSPGLPLLSVQVTRFLQDEGFVLGIGYTHVVADGFSFWHFMKAWAECAKGLPLSMLPIHMREALAPDKLILPHLPQGDSAHARSITQGGKLIFPLGPELVQRNFHFTAEMVRKLKHMVTSSAPEGHAAFSSLQALSAHLWRYILAARGVDKSRNTAFFIVANMRHRIVPPLPDAYFGNAIARDAGIALTRELQEESIGRTALRIQHLINSFDDTFMRTSCGNLEVMPPGNVFEGNGFDLPMLNVSGSPRFPVYYELDFGWGLPLCVRRPLIRFDGEMVWFAGREGGGSVDVSVALTKPVMQRLEREEGFLLV